MFDFDKFFAEIAMPNEAADLCRDVISALGKDTAMLDAAADKFFAGGDINPDISAVIKLHNIEPDAMWLTVCVYFAPRTYKIYQSRGIGDRIFFDSMTDISIWAKVCRRDWGHWGLHNEFGWLSSTLRATLFRLGRFQFEISSFRCDSYTRDGVTVKRGDRVINTHIPEGGPMLPELRYDSYKQAVSFWGGNVIVCDTWLFYPRHTEFLQPNSHILEFMRDFDIIDSDENESMGNMWRVFGRHDKYDPAILPRDTGMRRAYADWIAKVGKTGSGYGVRIEK